MENLVYDIYKIKKYGILVTKYSLHSEISLSGSICIIDTDFNFILTSHLIPLTVPQD